MIDALALYISVQEGEAMVVPTGATASSRPVVPPVTPSADYPAPPRPEPSRPVADQPEASEQAHPEPPASASPAPASSVDRPAEPALSGNTYTGESGATHGSLAGHAEAFDRGRTTSVDGGGEAPVLNPENGGHSGGDFRTDSGPFKGGSAGSPEGSDSEADLRTKSSRVVTNTLAQKDGHF